MIVIVLNKPKGEGNVENERRKNVKNFCQAETRRNLHTHTHTHTHTGNLLIAFLSTMFVVSGAFATDIPSSASTADCKNNPLDTYSGTSNLAVDWAPNEIALHWYDGDTELTVPTESQSCTYDGTLTPPTTIPTKTGYTFKGWRVKQAAVCSFASQVCGLNGSAVDGMSGVDYGYKNDSTGAYGADEYNASRYGLTTDNSWAAEFNTGIIKGIVSCNSTKPNVWDTVMEGINNETMTEEQINNTLWGTCNTDTFRPSNTFSSSSSGQYCWCKMESYTLSGGSACTVASSSWVFVNGYVVAASCANNCAHACAFSVGVRYDDDFRRAVFGLAAN